MPETPDRAALAERLRVKSFEFVRTLSGRKICPIDHEDVLAAAAALAAPAVPPDVRAAARRWHDVTWESPIIENSSRVEIAEDFRTLAAFVRGLP